MAGVSPSSIVFADRPVRSAGHLPTEALLDGWTSGDFVKDPPTATVSVLLPPTMSLSLLRIINSSSMSAYHIDLGQLDGELTAVDGFPVTPVTARNFPITVAQRLDIRLAVPPGPGAYPVLAVLEGERDGGPFSKQEWFLDL